MSDRSLLFIDSAPDAPFGGGVPAARRRARRPADDAADRRELIDGWLTELTDDLEPPRPVSVRVSLIAPATPTPKPKTPSVPDRVMGRWAIALAGLATVLVFLAFMLERAP